jgi:hypothetical protein
LTKLGALLFDPILLNFPGKARAYIVQLSGLESAQVKATIDQALKAIDKYLEGLCSVGNLAALHPGETQREAHHRHFSRLIAESRKAAKAQSVFLNVVSKSVLLYGRKSISYVNGSDGQPHRIEIPLQGDGTEMEFPRMEHLEPFGLDYMLRVFRSERLNA